MASGMTPAKRFIVRTALVAGSTIATVMGAQSLILLDSTSSNAAVASSAVSMVNTTTADSINTTVATSMVSTIRQATSDTSSSTVAVVPTTQAVQQVTVPSVPTTRSSR